MLVALTGVLVVIAVLIGSESVGGLPILAVLLALGLAARVGYRTRRPRVELGWAGPRRPELGSVPVGGGIGDDSQRWRPLVAPVRPLTTRRQVARALGRCESGHMLSSPWFGAGLGFCVVLTALYGVMWARHRDGVEGSWAEWFLQMPLMAHPIVGMTVVVAHRAVSRGRRDRVEELFTACPTDEATRTVAHLGAGWVPAVSVAGFVAVITLLHAVFNPRVYGPIDDRAFAHAFAAVALALGATGLGVALARWAPWRLAPIIVVVALVPVIDALGSLGEPHSSNARQLSSSPQLPSHVHVFTVAPVWWHLLWLAALGVLVAWLALVHAFRTRRLFVVGSVVAGLAVGTGVATTRDVSGAEASRLASLVAEPERHQTCRGTPRIEVCVYGDDDGYLDLVLANVAPIAAAAPTSLERITLRQVFDGDLDTLGPDVEAALDGRGVPAGDFIPLGFTTRDEAIGVARLLTAARAVGLPTDARFGTTPTVIAGEARGVVMLWLAARGLGHAAAVELTRASSDVGSLARGMAWPDPCYGDRSPSVAWSAQDLLAARALLDLPADDVHRLLIAEWERFTDPDTSTDELMTAAGLGPVGLPDRVVATPWVCGW